jgi:hypothetical protein
MSTVSFNRLVAEFITRPITGDLSEVPGIDEDVKITLQYKGIDTTHAIIGKYLMFKTPKACGIKVGEDFADWLSHVTRCSIKMARIIARSIGERANVSFPGVYEPLSYDDEDNADTLAAPLSLPSPSNDSVDERIDRVEYTAYKLCQEIASAAAHVDLVDTQVELRATREELSNTTEQLKLFMSNYSSTMNTVMGRIGALEDKTRLQKKVIAGHDATIKSLLSRLVEKEDHDNTSWFDLSDRVDGMFEDTSRLKQRVVSCERQITTLQTQSPRESNEADDLATARAADLDAQMEMMGCDIERICHALFANNINV